MKKRILIVLSCVVVILSVVLVLLNKHYIGEYFWQKIDERLDYERSIEMGDEFNKICWKDLNFQINHHKDGNNFEYVDVDNREVYILLKNISSYKISDNKLYVKSSDGYAIIDENNFCKIFVDGRETEGIINNYTVDSTGNRIYEYKKLQKNNVVYLSEYEGFDLSEKEFFKKMLK